MATLTCILPLVGVEEHERRGSEEERWSMVVPKGAGPSFGGTHGQSSAMQKVKARAMKLSNTRLPVLITGETGTGKEVLAESIHQAMNPEGPFVVFDCTTVAPTLLESALFGHEQGAFTGATSLHKGAIERAHGGTLLVDEIGDLPPELQPKLLRALERNEVCRVGGDRFRRFDVRILAASRRDLVELVRAGRFRDDLLYRIGGVRIALPPLRERLDDIPLLVRTFLGEDGDITIPDDLLERWMAYPWPGNVRELKNAVAEYATLGEWTPMHTATSPEAPLLPYAEARAQALHCFEQAYARRVLDVTGGNLRKALRLSGLSERYFRLLRSQLSKASAGR